MASSTKYATLYLLFASALCACSGEREEEFGSTCESNEECEAGQVCTDGFCAAEDPVRTEPAPIVVTVTSDGAPADVTVEIEGGTCTVERCEGAPGSAITFTAEEVEGYRFVGWSGHPLCKGTSRVLELTAIEADLSCTAEYVKRVLVTGIAPEGSFVRAGSSSPFSRCTGSSCEVDAGSQVTLTAPALPARRFTGWQGEGCTPREQATIVVTTGEADVTCEASYAGALEVSGTVSGAEGEVTASSEAAGAACGGERCTVSAGDSVTLRAPDVANHRFAGWSGSEGCTGTERELVLEDVQSDLECTASYVRQFVVRGASAGTPEPVVLSASSEDASAACADGACQVDAGGSATLVAPTVEGYRFTGFSGEGCDNVSGAAVSVANVSADLTCTANYVEGIAIIGSVVGLEGAEVTASSSTPAAQCSGGGCVVDAGGSVTLVAPRAPTGRRFVGWSGDDGCTGTGLTLAFTDVRTSLSCVASYTPRYTVSGSAQTGGSVRASSASANATCSGASCEVDPGSRVELEAVEQTGFRFTGWTGDAGCTGAAARLVLGNVQNNLACTANFVPRVTVNVVASPSAGGTVSVASTAQNAACTADRCTVDTGSRVTVNAEAAGSGFRFLRWSGCSTSANAALVLNSVTANTTCTAVFVRRFTVRGSVAGAPSGTVVGASSSDGAPIASCSGASCTVDANSDVTLTAPNLAASGYRFTGWSGSGCSGAALTLTFDPVNASRTCTANYAQTVTVAINRTPTTGGAIQITTSDTAAACTGAANGPRSCTIAVGASVTVSASEGATSRFTRWSGASVCSSESASTTFTAASNVTCTAEYYLLWAQVYQQSGVDEAKSIGITARGEVLIGGQSQDGDSPSFARLASLSPIDGTSNFDRAYAGPSTNATTAGQLITTPTSTLVVGSIGSGVAQPWLTLFDTSHNVVWSLGMSARLVELVAVTQVSDGGFVAVGRDGTSTARLLKVSAAGTLVFNQRYEYTTACISAVVTRPTLPVAVVARGSGFAVLHTLEPPSGSEFVFPEIAVTVHAADGSITASRRYAITNFDTTPRGMIATPDGGLLIVGSTDRASTTGRNGLWVKLNASLNLQWSGQLAASASLNDVFNAAVPSANGDELVLVGTASTASRVDTQGWVARLNASTGALIEHVTLGAPGVVEELHDIQRPADGGYVLAGSTSAPANGPNLWALRVDEAADIRFNAASGATRTVLSGAVGPGVALVANSCSQSANPTSNNPTNLTLTVATPTTTRTTQAP